MADRLEQIWKGFAGTTRAHLTSREISGMARPSHLRADERQATESSLEAGRADASEAVEAAFSALRREIEGRAKHRRRGGRAKGASYGAESEPLPTNSALDEQLFADMKFTDARVLRSSSDYLDFAAKFHAGKKRRKKFLGIF